jgi:hypothetical protein
MSVSQIEMNHCSSQSLIMFHHFHCLHSIPTCFFILIRWLFFFIHASLPSSCIIQYPMTHLNKQQLPSYDKHPSQNSFICIHLRIMHQSSQQHITSIIIILVIHHHVHDLTGHVTLSLLHPITRITAFILLDRMHRSASSSISFALTSSINHCIHPSISNNMS